MKKITVKDFAVMFGTTEEEILVSCGEDALNANFDYEVIFGEERDNLILDTLKKLDSNGFTVVGAHRKEVWEKGWGENLQDYIKSNHKFDALMPKYFKKGVPKSLNSQFIQSSNENIENDFGEVFYTWLFKKYLKKVKNIYSFGCGPGQNLVRLAKMYPQKKIFGLDWSENAISLVNKIREVHKYDISGEVFDIFHPNKDLKILPNSAVITIGCLEQIGSDYEKFIEYIIASKPKICVHSEPLNELYDVNTLVDYIALKRHKQRKYLNDFYFYLTSLQSEKKIEIQKIHRIPFGNMYQEGYSYIVWRPL